MIVEKRRFVIPELLLYSGHGLQNVHMGYETYGELNDRGDNAVLIAHYFTGTSHAAGRYRESDPEPGYWDALIGPGKAIDTRKYFVVSCDTLCNLNTGNPDVITTGPTSVNPATGRPWGGSFPVVTIGDFVEAQKQLAEFLGIERFHAVAGPSMGAIQALEWAARYPHKVDRVIAAISCGLATEPFLIALLNAWCSPILLDPNFRQGDYHDGPLPAAGLTEALKLVTLTALHDGWAKRLFGRRPADKSKALPSDSGQLFAIESALQQTATARAAIADANSFLRLAKAVQLFSIEDRKHDLRSKFLFLPAESDLLMFPRYAESGAAELSSLGLSVETHFLKGDGGHLDGLNAIGQASEAVRAFMDA
jgi:homoserine O-acetyltransferase/O-succinyltransferase